MRTLMKNITLVILAISLNCNLAAAQDYSVSLGLGTSHTDFVTSTKSVSVMGNRYFNFNFFRLGSGLRFTNWQRQSDLTINPSYKLSDISVSALNIVLLAEADILSHFLLGFNIDVVGGSFGKNSALIGFTEKAEPTKSNLLLGGKNDRGSLNSELYIGYKYNDQRWNVGWSHQVIEYSSTAPSANKLQNFFDTLIVRFDYLF